MMKNKIIHQKNVQTPRSFSEGKKLLGRNETYFLEKTKLDKDFHFSYDIISKEELQKTGKIKTKKDKQAFIFDASFADEIQNIKRAAQLITLKDAAVVLAETGINSESIVFDSGSGSGGLAFFLAKHCKEVYSFDIKEEHLDVCKKNKEFLNIKNVNFLNADVTNKEDIKKHTKELKCDLFTIDILQPENAIETVREFLKIGGYLVFYTTQLNQAKDVTDVLDNSEDFSVLSIKEVLHREWDLHNKKCKPKETSGHTGFLLFARKVC